MSYRENFKLIEWKLLPEVERKPQTEPARSDLPCPRIMSDVMEPVQSQATGLMYDSKSAIRAEYKRLGMVEIGNDPARFKARKREKTDRREIKDTVEKAAARFKRGERVQRHKIAQA